MTILLNTDQVRGVLDEVQSLVANAEYEEVLAEFPASIPGQLIGNLLDSFSSGRDSKSTSNTRRPNDGRLFQANLNDTPIDAVNSSVKHVATTRGLLFSVPTGYQEDGTNSSDQGSAELPEESLVRLAARIADATVDKLTFNRE